MWYFRQERLLRHLDTLYSRIIYGQWLNCTRAMYDKSNIFPIKVKNFTTELLTRRVH